MAKGGFGSGADLISLALGGLGLVVESLAAGALAMGTAGALVGFVGVSAREVVRLLAARATRRRTAGARGGNKAGREMELFAAGSGLEGFGAAESVASDFTRFRGAGTSGLAAGAGGDN